MAVRARKLFYAQKTVVNEESLSFSFRCSYSAESQSAPQYRDAMQAGGVGMCLVVDDQFAVIPRQYSAQYAQSFTGWGASAFPQMQLPAADLPGWGTPATAREVCARLESREFSDGMAETVLTKGLLVHAVPVEVARFPFRLSLHDSIEQGRRGQDTWLLQRHNNGDPAKEFLC